MIGNGPKWAGRLARYSLTGPENQAAVDAWPGRVRFRSAVPRKRMKELMKRSDYPAIRDTVIWLGLILTFAGLGIIFWTVWHSWWAVPFLGAYGLLYGSTSDSRWHESGHGTAFKTRWLDEGLYQLASFMIMRDPTTWRWSHTRHHTDTLVVGRDPEIAVSSAWPAGPAAGEPDRAGRRADGVQAHVRARLRAAHRRRGRRRPSIRAAQGLPHRPDPPGLSTPSPWPWPSGSGAGCRWC